MSSNVGVHEKGTYSVADLIDNVKKSKNHEKAGAIGIFIGMVRDDNLAGQGDKVEKITIESYEEKANESLAKICDDLSKKPGIVNVQIHHLLGEFNVGDDLVYAAVAGSHRNEVFPVLSEAIERYKTEVPIFKKERVIKSTGAVFEYWVSEKDHK